MTKEPQEETYQTLENKALEDFDERFYLPFHTPTEKKKEMVEYIKKVSKYVGGDTKLLTTRENVIDFLKSHLQLAFKEGRNENIRETVGSDEVISLEGIRQQAITSERDRIRKWAEENHIWEEINLKELLQELQNK